MNVDSTVRAARPEEWRELRALRLRMLAEDPHAFERTLAQEQAMTEEEWQARAEARDDRVVLVIDDDGTVVGVVNGEAAHIYSMWVVPERRGEGLGRILLDAVVAWARERGATRAVLDVNPNQTVALALYESAGFVRTGCDRALGGTEFICIELERPL